MILNSHQTRHVLRNDVEDYGKPWVAWVVTSLLIAAFVLGFLDKQVLTLTVTNVSHDLSIGDAEIGVLQGVAFSLPSAILALPLGFLVDRVNRRNLLICSVVLWSVATIGCGLTHSYGLFVFWRSLVGAGEAGMPALAFSMLGDLFAPHHRARASVILFGASSLSSSLSLVLGGALLKQLSAIEHSGPAVGLEAWRSAYLVLGFAGVALAGLLLAVVEPSRKEIGDLGGRSSSAVRYFLQNRQTITAFVLGVGMIGAVSLAFISWFPVWVSRSVGVDNASAGIAYGAVSVPTVLLASATAPLALKLRKSTTGIPDTVSAGLLISFLGLLGLPWANSLALALVCGSLHLFGFIWLAGLQAKIYQDLVPNEYRGQIVGLGTVVQLLFLSVVPTLIGTNSGGSGSTAASLLSAILWTGIPAWIFGIGCFVFLRKRYFETAQLWRTKRSSEARGGNSWM